jgi:heme/copper-type cytochrome/quinol oxidase subunit 3
MLGRPTCDKNDWSFAGGTPNFRQEFKSSHVRHVTVGLILLSVVMVLALLGSVKQQQAEQLDVSSLYWHFVDAVWVVVFTVVYVIGR